MTVYFSDIIKSTFVPKMKSYIRILDFGSRNGFLLFFLFEKWNIDYALSIELSKNLIIIQKKILKKVEYLAFNNNNTLLII